MFRKNTNDKYVKMIYVSTTCFGLFDKASSVSSIMHINNRKLLQDEFSSLQKLNKNYFTKIIISKCGIIQGDRKSICAPDDYNKETGVQRHFDHRVGK